MRRIKNSFLLVILLMLSNYTYACRVVQFVSTEKLYHKSDIIFVGEALKSVSLEFKNKIGRFVHQTPFKIIEVFKGELLKESTINITSNTGTTEARGTCEKRSFGEYFKKNKKYLIAATKENNRYVYNRYSSDRYYGHAPLQRKARAEGKSNIEFRRQGFLKLKKTQEKSNDDVSKKIK